MIICVVLCNQSIYLQHHPRPSSSTVAPIQSSYLDCASRTRPWQFSRIQTPLLNTLLYFTIFVTKQDNILTILFNGKSLTREHNFILLLGITWSISQFNWFSYSLLLIYYFLENFDLFLFFQFYWHFWLIDIWYLSASVDSSFLTNFSLFFHFGSTLMGSIITIQLHKIT